LANVTYDELVRALEPIAKDRTLRGLKDLPKELSDRQNQDRSRTDRAFGKMSSVVRDSLGSGTSVLAKAVTESGSLLLQGGGRISDVANIVGDSLGKLPNKFGDVGKALGTGVGFMAGYLEDTADTFRELQFIGAGLNGRLQDLRYTASQTRLNLDQFASLISNNNEKLVGFGAGVEDSIDKFANISNQMFELDAGAYAQQFMALGLSVEEMNEMLVDNIDLTRRQARIENMSVRQQLESAANYAKQLDVLAKLTGQDAKAVRDEVADRQRQGATQATLRQLEQRGVEGVQESYKSVQTALNEGPKVLRDLFDDVLQVGVPVTEATKNFAAVNSEAYNLAQQAADALKQGDMQEAQALAQRAAEETARFAQSEEGLTIARMGRVSDVAETQAGVLEETGPLIDAIKSYAEEFEGEAGSFVEAFRGLRRSIEEEQETQIQDTDPVLDLLNTAEVSMANTSAMVQREIANIIASPEVQNASQTAANKIGEFFDPTDIREFGADLRTVISDVSGGVEAIDRMLEQDNLSDDRRQELEETRNKLITAEAKLADSSATLREREAAEQNIELANVFLEGMSDDVKKILSPQSDDRLIEERRQEAEERGDPLAEKFYKELQEESGNASVSRQTGSLGETGKLIEDFGKGTLAQLHGRESVLTEEQLINLASNSMSLGSSMFADVFSNLSGQINNALASEQDRAAIGAKSQQSLPQPDFASSLTSSIDNMTTIQRDNDKRHQELLSAIDSLQQIANNMNKNTTTETSSRSQENSITDSNMLSTAINELVAKIDEQTSIARKNLRVTQGQGPNMFKGF